jgi:hypothetical protein
MNRNVALNPRLKKFGKLQTIALNEGLQKLLDYIKVNQETVIVKTSEIQKKANNQTFYKAINKEKLTSTGEYKDSYLTRDNQPIWFALGQNIPKYYYNLQREEKKNSIIQRKKILNTFNGCETYFLQLSLDNNTLNRDLIKLLIDLFFIDKYNMKISYTLDNYNNSTNENEKNNSTNEKNNSTFVSSITLTPINSNRNPIILTTINSNKNPNTLTPINSKRNPIIITTINSNKNPNTLTPINSKRNPNTLTPINSKRNPITLQNNQIFNAWLQINTYNNIKYIELIDILYSFGYILGHRYSEFEPDKIIVTYFMKYIDMINIVYKQFNKVIIGYYCDKVPQHMITGKKKNSMFYTFEFHPEIVVMKKYKKFLLNNGILNINAKNMNTKQPTKKPRYNNNINSHLIKK